MCGECNTTLQLYFLTVLIFFFSYQYCFPKGSIPPFHTAMFTLLHARVTFGMASLWALSVFWEEATPEVRVLRK